MAWPPSDIPTTNTDAGTDNPQAARADILGLMQAFNMLRNHFSTFMRGFAEAVDALAARTALGASTVGSNVFTAADAAAARSAIGAADAAATVNLTGAQTVAGLKTFSGGHLSTSSTQPVGYGSGSGSTVIQSGTRGIAVTINTPTGRISTASSPSLANGESASFTVVNSTVQADDLVLVNGSNSIFRVEALFIEAGAFTVRVTNVSGSTTSANLQVRFAVIRGAIA